jgi:GGDEF domain-containing protein
MNRQSPIHLHIEELVLHGFAPGDRHGIGDAMQRELARLLTEKQTPPSLTKNTAVDRLNGGTFQMASASKPEATGAQVARAVFGGLKQ